MTVFRPLYDSSLLWRPVYWFWRFLIFCLFVIHFVVVVVILRISTESFGSLFLETFQLSSAETQSNAAHFLMFSPFLPNLILFVDVLLAGFVHDILHCALVLEYFEKKVRKMQLLQHIFITSSGQRDKTSTTCLVSTEWLIKWFLRKEKKKKKKGHGCWGKRGARNRIDGVTARILLCRGWNGGWEPGEPADFERAFR